ncbi:MAG: universal stress protein [Smithella sp.]
MYKKVLVPLDGSELAECALSHVKNMVKDGFVEEVTILNVFPATVAILGAGGTETQYVDANAIKENHRLDSLRYVEEVKSRLASENIKTNVESVESNRTADTIIDYVQKNDIDLIVIATHGYSGLKKFVFGSVANQVLSNSRVPVLLIRPESCWT